MKGLLLLALLSFSSEVSALPAPAYLSVPQWKSCVKQVTRGSAQFVCLPSRQPISCPSQSWASLNKGKLVPSC